MIVSADIMKQCDAGILVNNWEASMHKQSGQKGFVKARLYQIYSLINTASYDFVSIVEWDDEEKLSSAVRHEDYLDWQKRQPSDTAGGIYTPINSAQHPENHFSPTHITVINPYRIPASDERKYADMWNESARHMENKDGFVSAQLYKAIEEKAHYYLLSRAEWQTEQHFISQFKGNDFQKIVSPFNGVFSISLSRLAAHAPNNVNR